MVVPIFSPELELQEPHHSGRARAGQVSRGGSAGQQQRVLRGVEVPRRQRHEPRREVRHVVSEEDCAPATSEADSRSDVRIFRESWITGQIINRRRGKHCD